MIHDQPERDLHRVTVEIPGDSWTGTSENAFDALTAVRRQLDSLGILLGVEGARLHSTSSGMMRDQGGGLTVIRLTLGQQGRREDQHDTFGEAPFREVATVEAQDAFFTRWLDSLGGDVFARIAEPAGYTVTGGIGSGYSLVSGGGDIRYSLALAGSRWVLLSQERSLAEVFEAEVPYQANVRRYLTVHVGNVIRTRLGLPAIWIESDAIAPGFAVEVSGEREKLMRGSEVVAEFPAGSSRAARMSWVATVAPDELLASYLHPEGEPHLARWLVTR